jgi:hypothetical protein
MATASTGTIYEYVEDEWLSLRAQPELDHHRAKGVNVTASSQPAEPLHLLTTAEAGSRLGLAGGYVAQLVNAGKLVPFAIAGRQRTKLFDPATIDELAQQRAARRGTRATSAPRSAA